MSDFSITIDIGKASDALSRAPGAIERYVEPKLSRGAKEIEAEAMRRAPKAMSGLWTSFHNERLGPLHYRVSQGRNYGRMVEEGTRPHFPNPDNLQPWVELVLGVRGKDARDKAFLIARAIARRGTRAQPYMGPAAQNKAARVRDLVLAGVDEGLREVYA